MNPGTAAALLAYGLWGMMPLYFQLMAPAGAVEVLAQRVLWSLALLIGVLAAQGQIGPLLRQLNLRLVGNQLLAALLVGANWVRGPAAGPGAAGHAAVHLEIGRAWCREAV